MRKFWRGLWPQSPWWFPMPTAYTFTDAITAISIERSPDFNPVRAPVRVGAGHEPRHAAGEPPTNIIDARRPRGYVGRHRRVG